MCVITLIANGGTGIDIDAQAIATTGLIDTGVFTADLVFVVVFAVEDDSTYVPTASPSEPPMVCYFRRWS